MKKTKCYIYTRVSTVIQVDGYSLDAQKDKIRKYAEFQEMEIVGEYSDEGHSGKNIKGRPEFMKMLNDIEDGKDDKIKCDRRITKPFVAFYLFRGGVISFVKPPI